MGNLTFSVSNKNANLFEMLLRAFKKRVNKTTDSNKTTFVVDFAWDEDKQLMEDFIKEIESR